MNADGTECTFELTENQMGMERTWVGGELFAALAMSGSASVKIQCKTMTRWVDLLTITETGIARAHMPPGIKWRVMVSDAVDLDAELEIFSE